MGIFSNIRGCLKHSRTQVDILSEQLVEEKAKLARAKLLPDGNFTIGNSVYNMRHGVDEKPKYIAKLRANIAYLETKIECNDLLDTDLNPSDGHSDAPQHNTPPLGRKV